MTSRTSAPDPVLIAAVAERRELLAERVDLLVTMLLADDTPTLVRHVRALVSDQPTVAVLVMVALVRDLAAQSRHTHPDRSAQEQP